MDKLQAVYRFLKSPQAELTIKRFIRSRKVRTAVEAGIGILEMVIILVPILKKTGERVNDLVQALQSSRQPARSGASRTRTTRTRTLPATSNAVH